MVLIGNKQGWGGGVALVKANGETKPVHLAPQFFLFAPTSSPHNTPFPPVSPPFPPISPHFPPFFLVLGKLRVRCWVYYHPPRPSISEACYSPKSLPSTVVGVVVETKRHVISHIMGIRARSGTQTASETLVETV